MCDRHDCISVHLFFVFFDRKNSIVGVMKGKKKENVPIMKAMHFFDRIDFLKH